MREHYGLLQICPPLAEHGIRLTADLLVAGGAIGSSPASEAREARLTSKLVKKGYKAR